MYVRNKAEALDALSEVLELPTRQQQIVQITVRVAMCLDAEARQFLADAQAALIGGGLEAMAKRRHELLAAHEAHAEGDEHFVIEDSEEDPLLEQIGQAQDALRIAEIVRQLHPEVAQNHEAWEVARAILAGESEMRQLMIDGVKAREGNPELYARCRVETLRRIEAAKPSWSQNLPSLRAICREAGAHADHALAAIATDDARAQHVLSLKPEEVRGYLSEVIRRLELLGSLGG